jgi:hypothetical protein
LTASSRSAGSRSALSGEAEHELERGWRAGPVRCDEIGAAAAKDVAQCEGDDDGVVEVARDRNEVGDEIERHEQVGDQGGKDELLASGTRGSESSRLKSTTISSSLNSRERRLSAASASARRNSRYSNDTTKKQPPFHRDPRRADSRAATQLRGASNHRMDLRIRPEACRW